MLDQLHGTLIAYEMWTSNGKSISCEATFKVDRKRKEELEESSCESNKEEEKFVKRLKRGYRKYKGNLAFKFFNYGEVGHSASMYHHKKESMKWS